MFFKIGHRGAAGYEPENTFDSFVKAIQLNVDIIIECDVRSTADGELVVIHDTTIDRTTNGTGLVREMTLEELWRFKIEKKARIPKLSWLFDIFGPYATIGVELKEEGIAEKVLQLARKYNRMDSTIISCFDDQDNEPGNSACWLELLWLKKKEPEIRIGLISKAPHHAWRSLEIASAYPVYAIIPAAATIPKILVEKVQRGTNSLVFVWTANEPEEITRLKAMNVNGIISDYPDRL